MKTIPKSLETLGFRKVPMCELVDDQPAEHFTYRRGKWLFVSTQAEEDFHEYHFEIYRFFASPAATIDWLTHLSKKDWFDPQDFCAMIRRFRAATGTRNELANFWFQKPRQNEKSSNR